MSSNTKAHPKPTYLEMPKNPMFIVTGLIDEATVFTAFAASNPLPVTLLWQYLPLGPATLEIRDLGRRISPVEDRSLFSMSGLIKVDELHHTPYDWQPFSHILIRRFSGGFARSLGYTKIANEFIARIFID